VHKHEELVSFVSVSFLFESESFFFSQYELQTLLIDRKFAIHKFVYCLFVLACLIVLTQKEGHHSIARQHVLEYTLLSIPVFIN